MYQETGSMQKVADEMDSSTSTVRKYVKKWEQKGLGDDDEKENGEAELDFALMGSTPTEAEQGVDFSVMSPGDFVQWYFEEDLADIDVNSVGLFARRCDGRNAIPTETTMRELLQGLPSNIGNSIQIGWISEEYWSRAVEYLSAKLPQDQQDIRTFVRQSNVDWVKVEAQANGHHQPQSSSGALGQPTQQTQQTQQQDMIGTPQSQPTQERVATPPQPHQGGDQTVQLMQQMLEEMRAERKQMMEMMNESGQQQNQTGPQSFSQQVQEIAEAQQALENFSGNDDEVEEVINAFNQELNQIRHQIQEGNGQEVPDSDPVATAMNNLTQRKDVDPEVIGKIAQNFNANSDPEVKKKEIDKEIEMMKHERREQMVDKLLDGVGEALQNVGGLAQVAEQLGDNQQPQQQQPRRQQPQQHHPQEEQQQQGIDDFSIDDMQDEDANETDDDPGNAEFDSFPDQDGEGGAADSEEVVIEEPDDDGEGEPDE